MPRFCFNRSCSVFLRNFVISEEVFVVATAWKVSVFGIFLVRIFYSISLRIQSNCGKIQNRKTPTTDTFHAVDCKRADIQIFSTAIKQADHIRHIEIILHKFAKFSIQINIKKGQFSREEMDLFDYAVRKNGTKPQIIKTEILKFAVIKSNFYLVGHKFVAHIPITNHCYFRKFSKH